MPTFRCTYPYGVVRDGATFTYGDCVESDANPDPHFFEEDTAPTAQQDLATTARKSRVAAPDPDPEPEEAPES